MFYTHSHNIKELFTLRTTHLNMYTVYSYDIMILRAFDVYNMHMQFVFEWKSTLF